MEREQQLTKLVNLLRRTARSVRDGNDEVIERARQQFNRVLETLGTLDESVTAVFRPLEEGVSGPVVAAACRDLAAYFQDEVEFPEVPFDADSLKDFWRQSAKDLEDVGDFIRESLGQFKRERKEEEAAQSNGEHDGETS
jgi:hypothetical protein